jgi:hypothetical protein
MLTEIMMPQWGMGRWLAGDGRFYTLIINNLQYIVEVMNIGFAPFGKFMLN